MIDPMIDRALLQQMMIDALADGERIRLRVVSNSMSPLLRVDDWVEVEQRPFSTLQIGDMVVVRGREMTTTHRLCRIMVHDDQQWLILRGDRRFAYDAPVAAEQYVGIVSGRVRHDRLLDLTSERGAWLNRHIRRIANFEATLFMDSVDTIVWSQSFMENGHHIADKSRGRWVTHTLRRMIRLVLFLWSSCITTLIR